MSVVYRIALVLVIIGAINWGLIGFFRFDLVAYLFGGQTAVLSRWIYALVGLAGLISLPILVMRFDEDEDLVPDHDLNHNHDQHTRIDRNPSYGMEFGDEADFTALKTTNELKEEKKDTHSKNKNKNKNKNKK
ncbi:hypothetical protein ACZ11_13160 [Lysinibacillus xylanilyticus]|uniref:DUF378 domain-containing protein n=1 Tax=Lysinibacillus xylanilyticus TaxID=582475 RepID=A0A0K9FEX4_9BACI|nr:DUF378 domain-containing protein [Lysinibacillus xylanilyticus]KMY33015.1 hypothetical protein ACZ11_13160 [Lysinibacillus xylanilyticus]